MTKPEKTVSTVFGIFAMSLTALVVLIFGAALGVDYESSCTDEGTGKVLCTTRSAWKGWAGIPFEAIASASGTAAGAYAIYLKTRGQQSSGSESDSDP